MSFLSSFFGGGGITAQQAKEEMEANPNAVVLDIRSLDEYKTGHIRGAKLIPLQVLQERAATNLTDKEQRILIYCSAGGRASAAARMLNQMGYTNVASFGGIMRWPYEIVR